MNKLREVINVTKSFMPPMEEFIAEIDKIWDTHWLTNQGPIHERFGQLLKKYLNINYYTLFVNGHLALDAAIKIMGIKGNVITTPFTFVSTTNAIIMNKLKPKFCDINKYDFTIDIDKIESMIDNETSAIIPVHVYGTPCNVAEIKAIADRKQIKIIYDAAHVFGVEIDGTGIGNYGDISMFSFHATKVFHSIEGGVVTYNNKEYESMLNRYRNFGITGPETVESIGLNAKMNEFQAAMGLVNLRYIDKEIEKRKKIAEIYRTILEEVEGISYLNDVKGVRHNYSYFPIIVEKRKYGISRDELFNKLREYNIFTRKYFYPLIIDLDPYRAQYAGCDVPTARYVAERVLTLPIYGDLKIDIAEDIAKIIKKIQIH